MKRGFTLTELLIVIVIISIMAGLALSALSAAAELAREQRTKAIIAKLDQFVMEKYEGYRTRAVPVPASLRNQNNPRVAAQYRLTGLRDLMRLELPDRITDICNANELADVQAVKSDGLYYLEFLTFTNQAQAAVVTSIPAVTRSYKRVAQRVMANERANRPAGTYKGWSVQHQGSECLYLILTQIHDGDKQATDFFAPEEIGDTDGDGMREILDGWGRPIEFIRWAPGYVTNPWDATRAPMLTTQTRPALDLNGNLVVYTPDIFDPAKVDPRATDALGIENDPFELRPLLVSSGRDGELGIILEDYDPNDLMLRPFTYRFVNPIIPNDAWAILPNSGRRIGEPLPASTGYADNITSHYQAAE